MPTSLYQLESCLLGMHRKLTGGLYAIIALNFTINVDKRLFYPAFRSNSTT